MIGLALFVGAVAFNVQMNSANNQTSNVTLKNIEALAIGDEEYSEETCCDAIWEDRDFDSPCDDNIYTYSDPIDDCTCQ